MLYPVTTVHYLVLSAALLLIGTIGVLARRNIVVILMSIELILNAVNINLVAFSRHLQQVTGQVFAIFVIAVAVAEAAVVGRPDETTGEAVSAFVVLKGTRPADAAAAQKIAKELRDWVGKEIGPIAKPKDIRFGDNLPKTRSGKIMRRLLRSIAKGEEITQDISTLENPAILEQLKQSL